MVLFAILTAKLDMLELDPFVGKVVQVDLEMMELFVPSLRLMEEELDTLYGVQDHAIVNTNKDVKNGDLCTIQDVEQDLVQLDVVFAHQIV